MKKGKQFKRLWSLMLLLIAMLVPRVAWATPAPAGDAEQISYSVPTYNTPGDANSGIASWSTKYADATVVTSSSERVTWEAGWYYVAAGSDITLAQGVDCNGDVHLILADGAKLTVKGIGSADTSSPAIKVTGDNSLTIYGQTNNTGELVADAYKNGWSAAIGGGPAEPGNNITINGGTITANGGIMAAAIGGGRLTETNASHDIVINGGVINATGRSSHPAIGAGWQSNVNGITINGGKITATSTTGVTAIGAGSDGSASNIKVNTSCTIFAGETADDAGKLTNEGNDLAAAFSGKKYVFIQPSHTHIYDKQIIKKEYAKTATCSAAGQYYYACSLCDECEKNDEHTFEGAPYSHKFTNYVADNNELTCTAFGTMTASCDYACGTTDTKADPARPALGHIWENDECTRCHATPGILYTGTQGTCTWIIYEDGDMVVSPTEGSTGDLGTWESGAYPSWNTAQTRPVVKTVCFTGSITAQQSFERAFCEFRNATSIDLTNLYTEKATNMGMLFYECNNLVSLNLANLKTDKATNLNQMFRGCSKLTSLDLSKFNTQDVTVMTHMFYNCKSLQSLTLGNFDMQKVTNVRNILELCPNLKTLTFKSLPYLADGTFNSQFTGDGVTVNYILDDNSVVFEGENHLPTATSCNHYLSKDNILQEPTCTETGLKQELCKICNHVKSDNITIPSLAHSYELNTLADVPDAQTENLYSYLCDNCGHEHDSKKVIKNLQNDLDVVIEKDAQGRWTTDQALAIADKRDFNAPVAFTARSVTFNRSFIYDGGMYSFCLPFDMEASNIQGGAFYEYSSIDNDDWTVSFSKVTGTIEANKGYFFYPTVDFEEITVENARIAAKPETTSPSEARIYGTLCEIDLPQGAYSYLTDWWMGGSYFARSETGNVMAPFRAYLWLGEAVNAAKLCAVFDGIEEDITGIDGVKFNTRSNDTPLYNLRGQRISAPKQGEIYIQNGKKVIKK